MLPVCFDGLDNDFDGRTDFPLDAGCISAAHDNETEQCGTGLRISSYPVGAPFVTGRSDDGTASNSFAGTCGQGLGLEKVYLYRNPFNARLDISVDFPETAPQTEIYVRRVCVSPASEVACNEGSEENGQRGSLTIPQASPGDYYIFVDHPNAGVNGAYKLAVTAERLEPSCSDGADNDDDGFIDADDPGCSSLDDEDERDGPNLPLRPQCDDGVDNDDDGEIDYPFDPGCVTRGTDDETDPDAVAQCNNGVDDDDDGVIDFPADSGCASRADDVEENGRRPHSVAIASTMMPMAWSITPMTLVVWPLVTSASETMRFRRRALMVSTMMTITESIIRMNLVASPPETAMNQTPLIYLPVAMVSTTTATTSETFP